MTLLDEDTSVVDGLGKTGGEHTCLQAPVQKLLDVETQHEIELLLVLRDHAEAGQTTKEGIAFKDALGMLQENISTVYIHVTRRVHNQRAGQPQTARSRNTTSRCKVKQQE